MKKRIGIQGALAVFTIVGGIAFSKFLFPTWKKIFLDKFFDLLGVYLVLFGFLLRITARGYKEEKSESGNILVKGGPYSLIRNPMYLGTLLIGIGLISAIFNWYALSLFLIIFLLIYLPQMNKEEAELSERFGAEYRDYSKSTPKYFPNLFRLLNIRDYLFFKASWIKKELFSLIIVFTVMLAIELWEDTTLFGFKYFLKEQIWIVVAVVSFLMAILLFKPKNR